MTVVTAPVLLICGDCDALLRGAPSTLLPLRCPRCNDVVRERSSGGLDRALALYFTAIVFLAVVNAFPILSLGLLGESSDATLFGAAQALNARHMSLVALLVGTTTILVPWTELIASVMILVLARRRERPRVYLRLLRIRSTIQPWNMLEIFALGSLVAIVKLGSLARILVGTGFWALWGFLIVSAIAARAYRREDVWNSAVPRLWGPA